MRSLVDGHQLGPSALGAQERLDSWKEIAVYLHRSERSVRRWEKQERLPVHRHMHGKSGSVYAYREVLDRWWISNDDPEPASGVSEPRRATAASTPRSDPSAVPRHIYCDSIYACIEEFNNRQSKRESELEQSEERREDRSRFGQDTDTLSPVNLRIAGTAKDRSSLPKKSPGFPGPTFVKESLPN